MLGISIDTLRRWDRAGKISVERDDANRRVVPAAEIARLRGSAGADTISARNHFRGVVRSVEVRLHVRSAEEAQQPLPDGCVEVKVGELGRSVFRAAAALVAQRERGEAAAGATVVVCPRRRFAWRALPRNTAM